MLLLSAVVPGVRALAIPLASFIAHMSGADFFGLIVSVLVIGYLFYALIRGEKL